MKYLIIGVLLAVIVGGSWVSGYAVGSRNTKIEYVTKEVEVVKYVERKKAEIYAKPNAGRDGLLKLMRDNKL